MMTTFAQLAKGGQQGEGITLEPGDPDASRFVELIRPDGEPRMPYKQDPLAAEKIALIERWVKEGAKYDGARPTEDWPPSCARSRRSSIPESTRSPCRSRPWRSARTAATSPPRATTRSTLWKAADGSLDRRLRGPGRAGLRDRLQPRRQVAGHRQRRPRPVRLGQALDRRARRRRQARPRPARDAPTASSPSPSAPTASSLAAAGADRAIRVWEVETGQAARRRSRTTPTGSSTSPSAPTASGSPAPAATRRARSSTSPRRSRSSPSPATPRRSTPSPSPPTARASPPAATTTRSGSGTPTTTASRSAQIGGFGGPVFRLQFTPDGKELVACGADKTVRVFDAANGLGRPDAHRATTTGSTRSPSPPTARRSPRGAGTARSASGTSPTASPAPHDRRRPRVQAGRATPRPSAK